MEILYIVGVLVAVFLGWTMFTTFKKVRTTNHIAESLNPEAKKQFHFWDTNSNKALALGKDYESKIFRAKALIVATTNCPISDTTRGNIPLVCQPGYVEDLSAADLDALIDNLQSLK